MLYQAPERLIDGDGGQPADCWSLGVILYTLAFAAYPFHHSDLEILKRQISNVDFQLPQNELADQVRPLLRRLLCRCPEERLSTGEILEWLPQTDGLPVEEEPIEKISSEETQSIVKSSKSTLKAKSHSSSKEYFSKLSKLIKLTREKIECFPLDKLDSKPELSSASTSNLSTVHYCLSSNSKISHKDELEE